MRKRRAVNPTCHCCGRPQAKRTAMCHDCCVALVWHNDVVTDRQNGPPVAGQEERVALYAACVEAGAPLFPARRRASA